MKIKNIFDRVESSPISAAVVLMISLLLANLLGVLKLRIFAQLFSGASSDLGVFMASDRIPNLVFSVLAVGALSASFVPIFSRLLSQNKENRAFEITATLFNLSLVIFVLVSLVFFPFSRPISGLISLGGNLSPLEMNLLDQCTRVLFLAQLFFILSAFASGVLQSFNRFTIVGLPPVVYNLVIIVFTLLTYHRLGIMAAAWGTVLGAACHFLVQLPALFSVGFRYLPRINLKDSLVAEIGRMFVPRSLSLTVDQLGLVIFTTLSLSLSASSVVIFSFAQRLMLIPVVLFGSTFSQASFATLSQNAESSADFLKTFRKVFNYISFLILPAVGFFIVLRIPFVRIFFGAKSFDLEATVLTANTLSFLALGMFFETHTSLLSRAFFAYKDSKTPLASALISLLVGVLASLIFLRVFHFGVWSLGLSFSIISLIDFLFMFLVLWRKFPQLLRPEFLMPLGKMILGAILSGLITLVTLKFFDQRLAIFDTRYSLNLIILTGTALLVGGLTYLLTCYYLGLHEGKRLVGLILRIRGFGPTFLGELFQE
ncbi:MAG: oligosaccharide flippase family protein [Patescibacteria group bacterium]|nr:oligosaccharide flippase family protein [Patescibacteria group bacterium]